jgi:hypothetical protein
MHSGPRSTGSKTIAAPHKPGSQVTVISRNGSVQLVADASRGDVRVEARMTCSGDTQVHADQRLAQANVEVSRDTAHTLIVRPLFPGGERDGDGADFVLRLPDADGMTIETSNGRVVVESFRGSLKIDTSNASVTVNDHDGPATIETSNGSINVTNLRGELVADTSNASVTATGIAGPATIDSSNGSITLALTAEQPGPIVLDTSNASISVKVGPSFRGPVTLDTSNGSLRVAGGSANMKILTMESSHATLDFGQGGASRVDTSNGDIEFDVMDEPPRTGSRRLPAQGED